MAYSIPQILIIAILLCGIGYCIMIYPKWNIMPTHTIEVKLSTEGLVSNKSYCNLRLNIEAGEILRADSFSRDNIIKIVNYREYTDTIALDKLYNGKCKYLYRKHPERFKGKTTFYYLDFRTHTNINSRVYNKDYVGVLNSDNYTLSFIENPKLTSDSTGTISEGSGVLGYSQCDGDGELKFYTNLLNSLPTILSPWDITQANYEIQFSCNHIKCDTISIEFIGATNFSSMHPIPDKTTMSGIEFNDSAKIAEIQLYGIRFHSEFLQLKEMSYQRTFLLSAILSLLISMFANIIFKWIYK